MNSSRLNQWLQVAANLGIVGGLLLVGVQLKQNADLLKTQLLYLESDRIVGLERMVVGEQGADVWARAVENPETLSLADQRIMEALTWSYVEQVRSAHKLANLGLLDENEWRDRIESDARFYLGNRYAWAWWRNFTDGNASVDPEIIAAIDARLEGASDDFVRQYMAAIMARLPAASRDGSAAPAAAGADLLE